MYLQRVRDFVKTTILNRKKNLFDICLQNGLEGHSFTGKITLFPIWILVPILSKMHFRILQ